MTNDNYNTRKIINYPLPSEKLAEFIGIFLGDGSFRNKHQIAISYNYNNEKRYAEYIENLVIELFGLEVRYRFRKQYGSAEIIITGTNLIDFLLDSLKLKDIRQKNRFNLPKWIWKSNRYKIGFIRGLFDSEGCIYKHRYVSNKKLYTYLKIAITNYLAKILVLLDNFLKDIGFNPVIYRKRIHIYNQKEVYNFLKLVGTNNYKNRLRSK